MEPDRQLYETTPGYDGSFMLLVIGERPDSGRAGPGDLSRVLPVGYRVDRRHAP